MLRRRVNFSSCVQTGSYLFCQQEIDFRFRLVGDGDQVARQTLGGLDRRVDERPRPVQVPLERLPDWRRRGVPVVKQNNVVGGKYILIVKKLAPGWDSNPRLLDYEA